MSKHNGSQMLISLFVKRESKAARAEHLDKERGAALVPEDVLASSVGFSSASLVRNENRMSSKDYNGSDAGDLVVHHCKGAAFVGAPPHPPRPAVATATGGRPDPNSAQHGSRTYKWSNKSRRGRKHGRKAHLFNKDWITVIENHALSFSPASFDWVVLRSDAAVKVAPPLPPPVAPSVPLHELIAKRLGYRMTRGAAGAILTATTQFMKKILTGFSGQAKRIKLLQAELYNAEQQGWTSNDPRFSYGFSQHFQVGADLPQDVVAAAPYYKKTVITEDLARETLCDERPFNSLPSLRAFLLLGGQRR